MAIVRWDPSRELDSLQSDMNRLFDTFFQQRPTGAGRGSARWIPAMDLAETDNHYALRIDLPGIKAQDVDIEVHDDTLTVSGERQAEHVDDKSGYRRVERSFGRFARTVDLPAGIEADEVTADFQDGVLEIRVPKPERSQPTKVKINSRDENDRLIEAGSNGN